MSDSPDPRQHAAAARRARAAQIHTLRLRVAAIAVTLFIGAWAIIGVQLVTGHDPALANDVAPVAAQASDPDASDDSGSGSTLDTQTADDGTAVRSGASDDTTLSSGTTANDGSSTASTPSSVTTGQS
jgi:hypothetical protein